MRACWLQCCVGGLFAVVVSAAHATHLGTIGEVFPIAEEDAIAYLQRTVRARAESGELARMDAAHRAKTAERIAHPMPVAGLRRTTTPSVRTFDPTVRLAMDLRDPDGKLVLARGTQANALDRMTLSKALLFFDARDREQVDWATRELAQRAALPVLVGGSYAELMRRWNRPVYFDQGGALVQRLGIAQVPARVSQDSMRLRIEEMLP